LGRERDGCWLYMQRREDDDEDEKRD